MSIIEEIKRDVRHDEDCNALRYCPSDAVNDATCNCSRRRKIAWLERLETPTQRMKDAFDHAPGPATGWYAMKVMLAAAEEDLP
jgi:hypothetical protein